MWLVETNTAVASACLHEGKCASEFSGPLSLGASFNRTSWRLKGEVARPIEPYRLPALLPACLPVCLSVNVCG